MAEDAIRLMTDKEIVDRFHMLSKKLDAGEYIAHALLCQRVDQIEASVKEKTDLFTAAMNNKASLEMLNGAMSRIEQQIQHQSENFTNAITPLRNAVYGAIGLILAAVIGGWMSGLLHTPTP